MQCGVGISPVTHLIHSVLKIVGRSSRSSENASVQFNFYEPSAFSLVLAQLAVSDLPLCHLGQGLHVCARCNDFHCRPWCLGEAGEEWVSIPGAGAPRGDGGVGGGSEL